jgi:malonyl-CoA/methylmalonyl-CoA synthetase
VERYGSDLAAILHTSGTTGRSKGARLTHDDLVSNALTLKDTWRFTVNDVLIHALPIYHTHGLFVASNVTLFSGASMVFLAKFDADEIIGLMSRANVLMGVPTFYVRLLQHLDLNQQVTAGMRLFVSGSAPLRAETHREWQAHGARGARALRHDRDQHEHLQPLRWGKGAGCRRPAAAGRFGAHH